MPLLLPDYVPWWVLGSTVSFRSHGVQRGCVELGEGDALRQQLQPGDGQAQLPGGGQKGLF